MGAVLVIAATFLYGYEGKPANSSANKTETTATWQKTLPQTAQGGTLWTVTASLAHGNWKWGESIDEETCVL